MSISVFCAVLAIWNLFGSDEKKDAAPQPAAEQPVVRQPVGETDLRAEVSNAVQQTVGAVAVEAVKAAAEKAAEAKVSVEATVAVSNAVQKAVSAAVAEAAKAAAAKAAAEKVTRDAEAALAQAARAEARADAKEQREIADKVAAEKKAEKLEELKRIESRIFKLQYASAEEVAEKFNTMWSGDFGVTWKITKMAIAFPESNSIMMTAPRVIVDACEKSLAELDVEAQQVYIEARFVELGNTASHKVGIDWTLLDGTTFTGTLGGGFQTTQLGSGVKGYTKSIASRVGNTATTESYTLSGENGSDGAVSYFNGTLNVSQMALTLKALDSTQDAKTFSNPKIIVSSGKMAKVDMTTKYPNVKVSAKRTDSSGSTSLDIASNMEAIPGEDKFMFAKESFFSWGISLEVTPRIATNGLINVSIVPTISDLESWVDTGTTGDSADGGTVSTKYPVIKVQRLVSEFNLASGTTAVIGGLSVTTEKQVDTGIPLLREIPWIGTRLFGSMERVKEQKEIIVFVTVGLVDPHNVRADAGLPKNAVLGRQYTKGQKLEPGDRPEKNMEGFDSLDMRRLEEQAKDPLKQQKGGGFFSNLIPFQKDPNYQEHK